MNYDQLFFTIVKNMNKANAHHWTCCFIASPGVMMNIRFRGRWEYELQLYSEIKDGKLNPPPDDLPAGSIYKNVKRVSSSWSLLSIKDGTPLNISGLEEAE